MNPFSQMAILILCGICSPLLALAQMPFYTDNADVTDTGTLHFEFFNEFDALQSAQYPNLQQNTLNGKANYGLPHRLELDVDVPYLSIHRTSGTKSSSGMGDTNL